MNFCTKSACLGRSFRVRIKGPIQAISAAWYPDEVVIFSMSDSGPSDQILDRFLPPVAAWFRETLGQPTPPQRLGWPAIAAGQNTLIVAPTGSGKTLAAFLAALDLLWRTPRQARGRADPLHLAPQGPERGHPAQPRRAAGGHPRAVAANWDRP